MALLHTRIRKLIGIRCSEPLRLLVHGITFRIAIGRSGGVQRMRGAAVVNFTRLTVAQNSNSN